MGAPVEPPSFAPPRAPAPAPRPVLSASPAPIPKPIRPAPTSERLLEIWVNGRSRGVIGRAVQTPSGLMVEAAALTAAGLKLPASGAGDALVPLASVKGVTAGIDDADQRLMIATTGTQGLQVLDARSGRPAEDSPSGLGFLGQYDVATSADSQTGQPAAWGLDASLAGTIFYGFSSLTSTGWLQLGQGQSSFTRLDTSLEIDEPDALEHWVLGDTISSNLTWSRAVRMAGLQFGRDFSLHPGLSVLPTPEFLGQAAVPSTVDVFVNAARVYSGQVDTGPFDLRNIPVVTGANEAVVVVRNLLGQDVTTTIPLYVSADQLAQGLSDFSLEAGALREAYSLSSFAYGPPTATGTFRYGLTNRLTLESHAELSPAVQDLGGGGTAAIGSFAAATLGVSASRSQQGEGAFASLGGQAQFGKLGLFATVARSFGPYADVASLDGPPVARGRLQVGGSLNFGRWGSLNASWIAQRGGSGDADIATASYSRSFAHGWQIGATASFDASHGDWLGEVSLRVPFGANDAVTSWADLGGGEDQGDVSYTHRVDPDGGFGYSVTASDPDQRVQAEATWVGPDATLDGELAEEGGRVSGRFIASGGIVAMGGSLYATRQSAGAFALVETGEPDVGVLLENRPIGHTDAQGQLLVGGLAPDSFNQISLVLNDLPFDAEIDRSSVDVAPRKNSGVVVDLKPKQLRPVLVVLQARDGQPIPAGAPLTTDDGRELVVGRGGEVFFNDLARRVTGVVQAGPRNCRFSVDPPPPSRSDDIPRVGPVACIRTGD